MKFTAVLMLAACLSAAARTEGQTITLKVKDVPMKEVFREIQKQTGMNVLVKETILTSAGRVTLDVRDMPVGQVLDLCFKNAPLSYSIVDGTIVVRKSLSPVAIASPIDVRGRVVDDKGNPVIATVTVKGTNKAVSTNENGEFEIKAVDENAVLVISGVNIETVEIKVAGKNDLATILVKIKIAQGEEVTINTGYQRLKPNEVTGSFQVISQEKLNQRVGPDILTRLEGTTTGILFDRRGLPGTENTVTLKNVIIRGISTYTDTVQRPLIVINNLPYEGDINSINPNDIESVTILKDAAASSIYGARGGNGVIVLTTKTGSYNQPFRLSLNSNVSVTQKPDLFYYPRMSSSDFIDMELFLFQRGYYNAMLSNTANWPAVTPVVEILDRRRNGLITPGDSAAAIDMLRTQDVRHDFDNYIYQTAVNQQYALQLSGGSPKMKYMLSGGLDKGRGNLVGNRSQRITVRSDNTISPVKGMELRLMLGYTNGINHNNSPGGYGPGSYNITYEYALYPYARFADVNGHPLAIPRGLRTGFTDTAGAGKLLSWDYRPLDEIHSVDGKTNTQDIIFNFSPRYRLSKSIELALNYQYQRTSREYKKIFSKDAFFTRDLINQFTQIQGTSVIRRIPLGGIVDVFNQELISQALNGQLNYNHSWNKDHKISLLAAGEIRDAVLNARSKRDYGYNPITLSTAVVDYVGIYPYYGGLGAGRIPGLGGGFYKGVDRFVSLLGNAAYVYKSRYSFSASFRRDASNLFGVETNNKWQPFWSIGGAWEISAEPWFRTKAVSYLRLRTTYGYSGNVNNGISPYTILSLRDAAFTPLNVPTAAISMPGNPELSWEKLAQLNAGIDFSIFNGRLSGSMDVYNKQSKNLVLGKPLDPTTGIARVLANSASLRVRGIDLSINVTILKGRFSWNSEILFSHAANKVTDYADDYNGPVGPMISNQGSTISFQRGHAPYAIYSLPSAGLDPLTGDPRGYLNKTISTDYLSILNQAFDTANLVYNGSAIPLYFGSFNNTFSYKGISLLLNVSYRLKYYFRKNSIGYEAMFRNGATHPDFAKRWQQPGDELTTTVPSMIYPADPNRDQFYNLSSDNTQRGDNIRLQYIRLAYTLDRKNFKKLPFQSAQLYFYANNLAIMWRANDEKLDPDSNTGNGTFPNPKTFSAGLQINL